MSVNDAIGIVFGIVLLVGGTIAAAYAVGNAVSWWMAQLPIHPWESAAGVLGIMWLGFVGMLVYNSMKGSRRKRR